MKLTAQEKKLLRQLAEAYAFIYDVRRVAIDRGDRTYILMTKGVEDIISRRRTQFPGTFQRYFKEAILIGKKANIKIHSRVEGSEVIDGERKDTEGREKKTPQEKKETKISAARIFTRNKKE